MMQYSKEGQDILVATLCKNGGFYLDIGAAEPVKDNNTYLLETLGWKGILIDQNENTTAECLKERNARAFSLVVEDINWESFLAENNVPKMIDYISLDVDDSNTDVMERFPFHLYSFKVMTFETDQYRAGFARKNACRKMLEQYPKYDYLLEDAITEDIVFEDWIINTEFFGEDIRSLKADNMHWKDFMNRLTSLG